LGREATAHGYRARLGHGSRPEKEPVGPRDCAREWARGDGWAG
jgi:hypothetical protein